MKKKKMINNLGEYSPCPNIGLNVRRKKKMINNLGEYSPCPNYWTYRKKHFIVVFFKGG